MSSGRLRRRLWFASLLVACGVSWSLVFSLAKIAADGIEAEIAGRERQTAPARQRDREQQKSPAHALPEGEPERVMAVRTRDGPIETNGRVTFSAEGANRTQLAIRAEFPGMDESMAATIAPLMERSAATIKRLIESET